VDRDRGRTNTLTRREWLVKFAPDTGCFPTGRHYPGIAHLLRVNVMGLANEIEAETSVADLPLAAIDTETTGRDPTVDRIVEVALVFCDAGEVGERRRWLVNPERPIPKEAQEVHGIDDDMVRDAPRFSEIAPEFEAALTGRLALAYNAPFDRGFLQAEFTRTASVISSGCWALRREIEWIDPLTWVRELQRNERSRALGEVCARLGIALEKAHNAAADAEAALRVLLAILPDARVPKTYGAFVKEQKRLAQEQAHDRSRWRSRQKR